MRKLLVALIGLGIMLNSCTKNGYNPDPEEITYYKLSDGIKTYFNYQVGTYWIFKDSLTNLVDSFAVTYQSHDNYQPSGSYFSSEEMSVSVREFYNLPAQDYRSWVLSIISSPSRQDACDINTPYVFNGTNPLTYTDFTKKFPFDLTSSNPNIQRSILPSLTANGKPYNSVYRYYIQYDNMHKDEILINADSGFIKLSFGKYANQVLELQRAHIVH